MTSQQYVYKVSNVRRVVDGDTYWLDLDVGFRQTGLVNIRLSGYDCPERAKGSAHEREQAKYATGYADAWLLATPGVLWVRTEPDPDDFGRWLGEIWAEDEGGTKRLLGEYLRSLGLASIWPQRWRDEFDTGGVKG